MARMVEEKGTRKESRLDIRATPEVKQTIQRAATIKGQNLSEFALSVLQPAAEAVLHQEQITRLSDRDRDVFFAMIDAPAEPNEALLRAADRYRRSKGLAGGTGSDSGDEWHAG